MINVSIGAEKPKLLTAEQLADVNEFRSFGFGLSAIAAAYSLSEFELRVQVSVHERQRQLEALREQAGGVGR